MVRVVYYIATTGQCTITYSYTQKSYHLDLGKSVDMHITKTGRVHLTESDSMRQVIYVLNATRLKNYLPYVQAECFHWNPITS